MGIPSALASYERETTQPSLLERTTTGRFLRPGANTRSQDTKKLSQSNRKNISIAPKAAGNDTPNGEIVFRTDQNRAVVFVGRYQKDLSVFAFEVFDSQFSVEFGDDDAAVLRGQRAVDNQDISVKNAGVFHRIAFDAQKIGGGRMGNQVSGKVEPLFAVVAGRRGKTGGNG